MTRCLSHFWKRLISGIPAFILLSCSQSNTINLADYGIAPNVNDNAPAMANALDKIAAQCGDKTLVITLPKGRYSFFPDAAAEREYYISNHDQETPKSVGLPFENMKNIVFDGNGSELVFHGRMLPVSLYNSQNCTLKNFSVDFEIPHIMQSTVVANDSINGFITYEIAPWQAYKIVDSTLIFTGEGWEATPTFGIAFEGKTRRLVYRTSDLGMITKPVAEVASRQIKARWKNPKLIVGTVLAMRTWHRPAPAIFVSYDKNTTLQNIQIHYAEGMGLLAQMSENITLDKFSVCLKGENDPRYFTTQADATHFSGCRGKIISKNGLYENMMDDAINVHGTYLKVQKRIDDKTLVAAYMHGQSYGFAWGYAGDAVQFINSKTMEIIGDENTIASIEAVDKPVDKGVKLFKITFEKNIDTAINERSAYGVENLTWTPEVVFAENTIRNNRARGSLFSTPRKVVVENNLFDHTSGTAVLLCGDCNGWYETGACRDVTIRKNRFINGLTNMFQFTNAIISIYPEIPDLKSQKKYFHSNIKIEDNEFETFDTPIVYAKSVDGLIFKNNTIKHNNEYPAFHWNKSPFLFERVINYKIENNSFDDKNDSIKNIIK